MDNNDNCKKDSFIIFLFHQEVLFYSSQYSMFNKTCLSYPWSLITWTYGYYHMNPLRILCSLLLFRMLARNLKEYWRTSHCRGDLLFYGLGVSQGKEYEWLGQLWSLIRYRLFLRNGFYLRGFHTATFLDHFKKSLIMNVLITFILMLKEVLLHKK